ncbi:hypothetical protein PTW37_15900 [Arthrobacter agilis]|uniref:hypothetical protein n=1 Tax=Arthrobacter agilis TaxID=37921 RepID=UPI002366979B|nr:hypothetical protein [Arthrobacter agilis]WDF33311.1 hypothetical protein PTW37_15900 [Arthrobacter agilis]
MVLAAGAGGDRSVVAGPPAREAVELSQALFERSPVAVVLAGYPNEPAVNAELGRAAAAAVGLHVPLLVLEPGPAGLAPVLDELDRLGADTVLGYGDAAADWTGITATRDLLAGPLSAEAFSADLGLTVREQVVPAADLVTAVSALTAADLVVVAIAGSGGGPSEASEDDAASVAPSTAPSTAPSAVPSAPSGGTDPATGPTTEADAGTGAATDGGADEAAEGPHDLASLATLDELPAFTAPEGGADALVLATAASSPTSIATARAAGAEVEVLPTGDPRATAAAVSAVHRNDGAPVYGIGADFGSTEDFAAHAAVAATGVELPGGGQTVFPGRRMVALYGHPSGPYLGALGEQDVDATMARVKELAAEYQPFSDEPVVPALDLIATVASADPGPDSDYSSETPVEVLEPWVDAAEKAGVYVVLDFQSGRTDFLSQVRRYEELLARPSVGLALDPEWRLMPGQLPLQQIGTVDAAEINASSAWLADLTRDRNLPQKLFMVHQFRLDMIGDRAALDTSRSELAVTLHADGHGTPGQKLDTWAALQGSMPAGVWPSWKNFYDEDQPMLGPEETYALVDPKPWLVTYQ